MVEEVKINVTKRLFQAECLLLENGGGWLLQSWPHEDPKIIWAHSFVWVCFCWSLCTNLCLSHYQCVVVGKYVCFQPPHPPQTQGKRESVLSWGNVTRGVLSQRFLGKELCLWVEIFTHMQLINLFFPSVGMCVCLRLYVCLSFSEVNEGRGGIFLPHTHIPCYRTLCTSWTQRPHS